MFTGWDRFHLVSHWTLDSRIDEFRDVLMDPLSMARWCPSVCLRVELLEPGDETGRNMTTRWHMKGWLPHSFQFLSRVAHLADDMVEVEVRGDFEGRGTYRGEVIGDRLAVTCDWRVRVRQTWIRPLLFVLKPVFILNHGWAGAEIARGLQAEIDRRRGSADMHAAKWPRPTPTFPHNLPSFAEGACWQPEVAEWNG